MKKQQKRKSYKRKFNPRLIKSNTSYLVSEVMQLFGVAETTIRYWLKNGLKIIDGKTPIMIHCEDLREFLIQKQKGSKKKCQPYEMFCFSCRQPRRVLENQAIMINKNDKILHLKGRCQNCNSAMTKKFSAAKLAEIEQFFTFVVNYKVNT